MNKSLHRFDLSNCQVIQEYLINNSKTEINNKIVLLITWYVHLHIYAFWYDKPNKKVFQIYTLADYSLIIFNRLKMPK